MTEIWLCLDDRTRPADSHSRFVFGTVLKEVYSRFAQIALAVAVGFFLVSIVFMGLGFEPYVPAPGVSS